MLFFRVISRIIIFVLISYAGTVNAKTTNKDYIVCPKISSINQAAALMNQVECNNKRCTVSTDINKPAFYENGLYWVLMGEVSASSKDEAILKAQKIAADASVMHSEIATMSTLGLCGYYVISSDYSEKETIVVSAGSIGDRPQISSTSLFLKQQ